MVTLPVFVGPLVSGAVVLIITYAFLGFIWIEIEKDYKDKG
jgi:hypothetical protein